MQAANMPALRYCHRVCPGSSKFSCCELLQLSNDFRESLYSIVNSIKTFRPSKMQAPKSVGCYKCGKAGHWSRDCTAPQSEWIDRSQMAAGTQLPGSTSAAKAGASVEPLPLPPGKKKRTQMPKLTFDVLKDREEGLPRILSTFAERFRKKYRGKGHEASDLRRLLEMYERWQHKLFPSMQFDEFLAAVEKMGRTAEVKKELRVLRTEAIALEEKAGTDEPAAGAQESPAGERQLAAEPETASFEDDDVDDYDLPDVEPAEQDDDAYPDSDNEDLFAMMEKAAEVPSAAAANAELPASTGAAEDELMVDLFDTMDAAAQEPDCSHPQPAGRSYYEAPEALQHPETAMAEGAASPKADTKDRQSIGADGPGSPVLHEAAPAAATAVPQAAGMCLNTSSAFVDARLPDSAAKRQRTGEA